MFRDRGYHAVAVDDLGAAVGISGPAIYKHFESKQALLVELFDEVADRLLAGGREITDREGEPGEKLEALVAFHAGFASAERTLIAVYMQEERNLPAADRARLRRHMRQYGDGWIRALRGLHPQIAPAEARARVMAAIGLLNSVANFEAYVGAGALRELLVRMTKAALQV